MKHLKTYENIGEVKIGDYVKINASNYDGKFKIFLNDEIGKLIDIVDGNGGYPYVVEFERKFNQNNKIAFKKSDIINWNKEKDILINTIKYNI